MRNSLMLLPLLMCGAPALGQAAPAPSATADIQRVLADPAMAEKLTNVMQVLSKSFMDLPVGEVQAAIEGRPATPAERKMTVRDMGRRSNPNFDREMQQQMANAGPMIRQSMTALGQVLPGMTQGLTQMQQSLERAVSNLPDPTYPKR